MTNFFKGRARGRINPPNLRARHAANAARHEAIHREFCLAYGLPSTYDCSSLCTPIKDQGSCGSCWDFSGTCLVEAAHIKAGTLPDNSTASQLSEQYTLDSCDGSNGGCGGDDNVTVLADAKSGGLPLTSDYGPYTSTADACKWAPRGRSRTLPATVNLYTLADWGFVSPSPGLPTVALIKAAMLRYGPIGCAVAADDAFEEWGDNSPSLAKPFTGSGSTDLDHDIVLVGWSDDTLSWLLRNSWGPAWGVNGYMAISYSANLVGTEAVWATAGPVVPYQPEPPAPPAPCHGLALALRHGLRSMADALGRAFPPALLVLLCLCLSSSTHAQCPTCPKCQQACQPASPPASDRRPTSAPYLLYLSLPGRRRRPR